MLEEVSNFLGLVALLIVPYALCSLGIMLGGRTGVLNISADGVMIMGASVGFLAASLINTEIGFLFAMIAGAVFGFVLVYMSERWKINPFIISIILFVFGMGLADFLYKIIIGIRLTPPLIVPLSKIAIPGLSQLPVVGALFNQNILVYFTYVLVAVLYFVLYRTRTGLDTRSVGENPKAADSAGINVFLRRCICTMLGGMMMGLAGFYLPLMIASTYTPGGMITGGRGFMAIGLTIFGSFRPERILAGSFLFAGVEAFSFTLTIRPIISYQFLLMLPFVAILIVMTIFYKRIEYPAAIGRPYSRE